jgi:toluene monooxygenase system ferredoxin subunit
MSDAARWHEVMDLDDLWEGDIEGVDAGGTKVVIVNVDGEVRAYRDRCPHQAWPLHDGDLDGEVLTCINHLWEFNAVTGEGINPADSALFSIPCKVEGGVICVAPPG